MEYINSKNLVNGEYLDTKEHISIYSPIDNNILGITPSMTREDVDYTMDKARKATKEWGNLTVYERAQYLHRTARELEKMKEELATILTKEIAKSYKDSLVEIERTIELIDYTAEEGIRIENEIYSSGKLKDSKNDKVSIVKHIPMGVVLCIAPFNYPINLSAAKIAPALIAGNTVIFKPPTQGAVSALKFMEAFYNAGYPAGVVNSITGRGREIGDYLIKHKEVDFINFTGSTEVGVNISKITNMTGMILELGGKDAAIVLKDADIDKAVNDIISGAFSYSAQRCTAIKRVLVDEKIANELEVKLLEKVKKLKVGNPFDNADITPLIDNKTAEYIEELVKDTIKSGGKALTEYKRENNLVYPMLFTDITNDMRLAREEPFGPVLPIIKFKDIEEAINLANDTEYGLQSSVFTNNINDAFYIANKLEVGTVQINNKTQRGPDNFPFLGIKNSGFGIQGIYHSIISMTKIKSIVLDIGGK